MDRYRKSYHGLQVYVYNTGTGPYGPISVSSLKMDGLEKLHSIMTPRGGRYDPTPQPFDSSWFTSISIGLFDFPHTLEVTWFIHGEEQLYHTIVTMPSYRELQKIVGVDELSQIGLGIIYDMPPQVKCFVFRVGKPVPWKYHLVATGMGTPISGPLEKFDRKTRSLCGEGVLPEKICAKYRTSPSEKRKQKHSAPSL